MKQNNEEIKTEELNSDYLFSNMQIVQHDNLFNIYIYVEIQIKICSSYIEYDLGLATSHLQIKILIERKGEKDTEKDCQKSMQMFA